MELGPHARSRTTSRSSSLLPVSRAVPLPPANLSPRLGFIARARVCDSSHPPPCRPWCVVRVVCVALATASRVSSPAAIVHSAARRSLACARCSPLVLLFTRRCTRTMMIRRPRWCVVPRNRASCLAPPRRTDVLTCAARTRCSYPPQIRVAAKVAGVDLTVISGADAAAIEAAKASTFGTVRSDRDVGRDVVLACGRSDVVHPLCCVGVPNPAAAPLPAAVARA